MPGESEDRRNDDRRAGRFDQWREGIDDWRQAMDGPEGWTKGMDKRVRTIEARIWYAMGAAFALGLTIPQIINFLTTGAKHP